MAVNKSDFDKICRMCLLFKINMFSIYAEETIIAIKNCVDIEVKEDDDFPRSICFDCLEKVYTYATFRELCKNSEKILSEIVKKDYKMVDSNYKDDYSSYCKQENTVTNAETIKNEVVVKEELDSDDKEDKSQLLVENKIDEENKDDENDSSNSLQDEEIPVKEIELKNTVLKQSRKRIRVKKHKCDKCPKTYGERSVLAKHLIRAHKAKPDLKCDVCGKLFVIQAQLDCHKRIHPKSKTCDICGKEVNRLERHKKSHDRSEKFFCLKCDASFYQESYLETHVKRFHSGTQSAPKKEECPLCNKVVSDVKVHTLKVHSQKSHKCDQCEEAFAFRSLLLDHVKKKHLGIRDECKALCPTCGKAYPSNGELKQHLRTHTEERQFGCHLCDKRYKTNAGLHFHLKVHAGIRPFICTHCGKGFHTKVILENHLRTHTGERPFACAICGHAFTQKVALRTHMKTHRGGHREDSILAYA